MVVFAPKDHILEPLAVKTDSFSAYPDRIGKRVAACYLERGETVSPLLSHTVAQSDSCGDPVNLRKDWNGYITATSALPRFRDSLVVTDHLHYLLSSVRMGKFVKQ